MTSLSTHVLDAVNGAPARDVAVTLDGVLAGRTDVDGRLRLDTDLAAGTHRITFDTGAWSSFYPEVTVAFTVDDQPHVHVPLLLSAYSYTTYLGS